MYHTSRSYGEFTKSQMKVTQLSKNKTSRVDQKLEIKCKEK